MPNDHEIIDDRINVRVGEELKKRLDALVAADPGDPGMAVIVRRLLVYGLLHEELEKRLKQAVAHIRKNRKGDRFTDDAVSDWLGETETLLEKSGGKKEVA